MFLYHWNEKIGKIDISIIELQLGRNSDIVVEELMHPYIGLCYSVTIDDESFKMKIYDIFVIKAEFHQDKKTPQVELSIINPEDRYGILFPEGHKAPLKIIPEPETYNEVLVEKSVWNYLPSKANCKYYSKENTYQTCKLKMQVDCFRSEAPKKGCDCVPENAFKTAFKVYPIDWNECKTDKEFMLCSKILNNCALEEAVSYTHLTLPTILLV